MEGEEEFMLVMARRQSFCCIADVMLFYAWGGIKEDVEL
jgi:hypothetical protein